MSASPIAGCIVAGLLAAAPAGADTVPRGLVEPAPDWIIQASVLLAVPPARAVDYFTDGRLIESWLTAVADVEPRVGGKYELFWQPDDPENDSTIGCRITALVPGQLIAFQWRGPRQFKPLTNAADPLTHVVVAFVPEGRGTRVHLIHSGWRSAPEWEAARVWQERAWLGALARLRRASLD